MSEEQSSNPVRIAAEERSRPVFRLLARAFILLAQQQAAEQPPPAPTEQNGEEEGGYDNT